MGAVSMNLQQVSTQDVQVLMQQSYADVLRGNESSYGLNHSLSGALHVGPPSPATECDSNDV